MNVKTLQEPDDNGCDENDTEGLLDEVLRLLPEQLPHVLRPRHTIIRQLHDERNRLPFENRPLEKKCRDDREKNSEEI